ncbi:hypothetical protein I3760_03G254400 [Carya illinoinensis]|nr:hypothetical protein I3760_03G254400 [Carya illinoinensis]
MAYLKTILIKLRLMHRTPFMQILVFFNIILCRALACIFFVIQITNCMCLSLDTDL